MKDDDRSRGVSSPPTPAGRDVHAPGSEAGAFARGASRAGAEVVDPGELLNAGQRRWLTDVLQTVLRHLALHGELRVRLLDDSEMAAAHERHLGISGPTDVLTFDYRRDAGEPLDADVLVCADEARRQQGRHAHASHPLEREIALYAVHGLLHCLGYDDRDEESAAAMHRKEDEILEAVGVGAAYGAAGGGAHGHGREAR